MALDRHAKLNPLLGIRGQRAATQTALSDNESRQDGAGRQTRA